MKKIVILVRATFSKRDYERFGIDYLKKKFSLKIIDFSPWLHPDYYKQYDKEVFQTKDIVRIEKEKDFLALDLKSEQLIIFDFLDESNRSIYIRNSLKNDKNKFLVFDINPIPHAKKPVKAKIKKYINLIFNKENLLSYFVDFFIYKNLKNNAYIPDISVVGGLSALKQVKAKNKIHAHNMDYDSYLQIKDFQSKRQEEPFAVFVDQDLVTHPDLKISYNGAPVTESNYYPALINFFNNFKNLTGLNIKFAVHPRSRNKKISHLLQGIDYSFGNTRDLIKDSSLVLTHTSTAISLAMLFKKPTIILTSNELKKSWLGNQISDFAKFTNMEAINIDQNLNTQINLKELLKVNEEKYQRYIDQYVKMPNSPNLPLWKIISDYLTNF